MSVGIYCFENIINLHRYVGKSIHIDRRRKEHLCCLRNEDPEENKYFIHAWKKYGEESFRFWIVEECLIEMLDEREIYWIKELRSHVSEHGYNLSWGGEASFTGLVHSDEAKQRQSEAHIGKHHSPETRASMSASAKKRGISPETRKRIVSTLKGQKRDWHGRFMKA